MANGDWVRDDNRMWKGQRRWPAGVQGRAGTRRERASGRRPGGGCRPLGMETVHGKPFITPPELPTPSSLLPLPLSPNRPPLADPPAIATDVLRAPLLVVVRGHNRSVLAAPSDPVVISRSPAFIPTSSTPASFSSTVMESNLPQDDMLASQSSYVSASAFAILPSLLIPYPHL